MFTHLDDPQPPPSGSALRRAVRHRVRRRRQRRVAVVGGVAAVAGIGVAGITAAHDRVTPEQIDVAGLPEGNSAPDIGEPMTVLLVGVDSVGSTVPGEAAALPDGGGRSDTIIVARVDPAAGELRLLMVPRDLAVPGHPDTRFNALLPQGGAARLAEAVGALGIEVDHYVEVDFAGARGLVDAVGGVEVSVPAPVRAATTGLALAAGCQRLDGDAVLGLARSRRDVQVLAPDGGWRTDPSGELGRQVRAGVLAAALLAALGDLGPEDVPALVREGLDMVTVDSHLDPDTLVEMARLARSLRLVTLGLPVTERPPGGPAILDLADGAEAVVAGLLHGGVASGPPVADGTPTADATALAPC